MRWEMRESCLRRPESWPSGTVGAARGGCGLLPRANVAWQTSLLAEGVVMTAMVQAGGISVAETSGRTAICVRFVKE